MLTQLRFKSEVSVCVLLFREPLRKYSEIRCDVAVQEERKVTSSKCYVCSLLFFPLISCMYMYVRVSFYMPIITCCPLSPSHPLNTTSCGKPLLKP